MTPATTTTRRAMPDVDTVTAAFDVEGAKVALEHALVSAREALERAGVRDFDAFFRDVSRAARDLTTHDVSKVLSVDVEAIFRDFGGGKVLDVASHASHAMQEVVGGDASGFALEALQTAKSAVPKEMLDTVNENPEASTAVATLFTAITALSAGSSSSSSSSQTTSQASKSAGDALPTTYDIEAIRSYWQRRPQKIIQRSAGLAADLIGWIVAIIVDVQTGSVEKNSKKRAETLRDIVARQGAAFVKVGQAVAIRPDILPPAYLEALQTLLDQVAPFESGEARELMKAQLGTSRLEDVFEDASVFDKPIAAASIGQVYKARLKRTDALAGEQGDWGLDVAVKVQRPNILDNVSLDLLVIRTILEACAGLPKTGALAQIQQGAAGFIPVLDVAAERFLEELDYGLEASNAARFEKDMTTISVVRGTIKVPHVFLSLSGRQVLTQEWVNGRKLTDIEVSNTTEETRKKLVETLLNSYMIQLLETGFLHADPHPGNFLLMDDGRLCILDYGMMTTISEEQRIAFVEYIAHLSAREYDKTLNDLVNLGFVPPELADDPVNRAIVVPVLAETLETLYGSGGGITTKTDALADKQKSRVGELGDKLEEMSKKYPLQLPPYFVLILRAFGTLEGLGLSVDSNYAIIDDCFPYVARRLLSDDSPRMRAALRSFVYGGSDRLRVSRVRDIASGFSQFTNTMGASEGLVLAEETRAMMSIDPATRDALAIVFSAEGNYLQDLVVEEAVRAADALSRNTAAQAWRFLGQASPFAALASVTPLALIPGLNIPIFASLIASQNKDAITLTFDDKKNLALLRALLELVGLPGLASDFEKALSQAGISAQEGRVPSSFQAPSFSQSEADAIRALAPTVAPGLQRMATQFTEKFSDRVSQRTRDDLQKFQLPGPGLELAQAAFGMLSTTATNRGTSDDDKQII